MKISACVFLIGLVLISCSPQKPLKKVAQTPKQRSSLRSENSFVSFLETSPQSQSEVPEDELSTSVDTSSSLEEPIVEEVSESEPPPVEIPESEESSPPTCLETEELVGDKCIPLDPCVIEPTLAQCRSQAEIPVNRYCSHNLIPLLSISYRVVKDTKDQILTVIEMENTNSSFKLKSKILSKTFRSIKETNNLKLDLTFEEKTKFKLDSYYLLLLTEGEISEDKLNTILTGKISVVDNKLSDKITTEDKEIQLFFARKNDKFWSKDNSLFGTGFISGYKFLGGTKPEGFKDFYDLQLKSKWNSEFQIHLGTTEHSLEALMVAFERKVFYDKSHCIGDFTNPRPIIAGAVVVGLLAWFIKTSFFSPLVLKFQEEPFKFSSLPSLFDLSGDGLLDKFFSLDYAPRKKVLQAHLAVDLNQNGIIDSGLELFGDYTITRSGERASNGFEALREYDLNQDGLITLADTEIVSDKTPSRLVLWFDRNNNMKTDKGELRPLFSYVKSIYLDYIAKTEVDKKSGNQIRFQSEFEVDQKLPSLHSVSRYNKIVDVYYRILRENFGPKMSESR